MWCIIQINRSKSTYRYAIITGIFKLNLNYLVACLIFFYY